MPLLFHKVSNNAETLLASALLAGATTMQVTEGVFPAAPFWVTCLDFADGVFMPTEIIEVTAKNGSIWTISRGCDGTTDAAHAVGTGIQLLVVADIVKELQDAERQTRELAETKISEEEKGVPGGVPTLDEDGLVPFEQLPPIPEPHPAASAGDGISVSEEQVVANTDKGSTAVSGHESSFDHSKIATAIQSAEKGANNGVADLDAGGKIKASQLPNTIMEFKGNWNPTTNTPELSDGTGNTGDVYRVSVSGIRDLGSGNIAFNIGDWVMCNGSIWEWAPNSNFVLSVNGQQGIVVLSFADLGIGDIGTDKQIPFNSNGLLGGNANFTYDPLIGLFVKGATTGAGKAPLIIQNTSPYADPWTQFSTIWLDPAGAVMAHVRNDGTFEMGGAQGMMQFKKAQAQVAGSASSPAYGTAYNGDTNTGMYFPAADNLAFSTGGLERFRITESGLLQADGAFYATSDGGVAFKARGRGTGDTFQLLSVDGQTVLFKMTYNGAVTVNSTLTAASLIAGSVAMSGVNGLYYGAYARGKYGFGAETAGGARPLALHSGDGVTYTGGYIPFFVDAVEIARITNAGILLNVAPTEDNHAVTKSYVDSAIQKPAHLWNGTILSFENPDGTYDDGVDLKGADGQDYVGDILATAYAADVEIDWELGSWQQIELTGACNITFSNAQANGHYVLILKYTGAYVPTFVTPIAWPNGLTPMWTMAADKYDYLGFVYNGSTWHGVAQSLNV